jgi:hypothetical protein
VAGHKKMLIVDPAVADKVTGPKWNRYAFRSVQFIAG